MKPEEATKNAPAGLEVSRPFDAVIDAEAGKKVENKRDAQWTIVYQKRGRLTFGQAPAMRDDGVWSSRQRNQRIASCCCCFSWFFSCHGLRRGSEERAGIRSYFSLTAPAAPALSGDAVLVGLLGEGGWIESFDACHALDPLMRLAYKRRKRPAGRLARWPLCVCVFRYLSPYVYLRDTRPRVGRISDRQTF